MATSSWRTAGTVAATGSSPHGVAWTAAGTAGSLQDGVVAGADGKYDNTQITDGAGFDSQSQFLDCSNFNFSAEVASSATITAVRLRLTRRANSIGSPLGTVVDDNIRLIVNGSAGTVGKEDGATNWPTTFTAKTYSDWAGNADGLTTAFLRQSNFGVRISCFFGEGISLGGILSAQADFVEVQVDYTIPASVENNLQGNITGTGLSGNIQ